MTPSLFDDPTPSPAQWFTAHCDGGSRGNPGPSAYGAVIEDPQGREVARLSKFLGRQTNNFAEYSGLLAVLHWAIDNGVPRLRVVSDSELMVKQMRGQYKVNNPGLRPLWEEARQLARRLEAFDIRHTLRGGNQLADKLANDAMDLGMGKTREEGSGVRDQEPVVAHTDRQVGDSASSRVPPVPRSWGAGKTPPPKQTLDGYVKNGVVHLLDGELPEGAFVKIIRE